MHYPSKKSNILSLCQRLLTFFTAGSDSESPTRQSSFLEGKPVFIMFLWYIAQSIGLGVGIVVGVVSTSAVMIAIIIIIMKCKQLRGI